MITAKFYLRNRVNKHGLSPLYFIIHLQKQVWVSCDIFINPHHWDPVKETLYQNSPQYYLVAPLLNKFRMKADLYLQQIHLGNLRFDEASFKQAVIDDDLGSIENPTMKSIIQDYINANDFSFGRNAQYKRLISELNDLKQNIRIKDISYETGLKFQKQLRKSNCENTVINKMHRLKAIVHFAMQKKLLKEDPLKPIKLSEIRGNRSYLTIDELLHLQQIFDARELDSDRLNVLRYFLFSCYTSFRYTRMYQLSKDNLVNNVIITETEKKGSPVEVPLITEALRLLDLQPDGKLFAIKTNQHTNRMLKDIAAHAGIQKHLTYHCARHTFATTSISLGMPLDVVKKIMGHKKRTTTEIYLHIMNDTINVEMKRWENLTVAHKAVATAS
ncbi:MAG: hypothetical protein EKK37_17285 [Sphingobacteriales bacterium]|nr:MAG: hypothetical protein EKK37_17285 [Sphingobacteriales bacterium]